MISSAIAEVVVGFWRPICDVRNRSMMFQVNKYFLCLNLVPPNLQQKSLPYSVKNKLHFSSAFDDSYFGIMYDHIINDVNSKLVCYHEHIYIMCYRW